MPLHGVDEFARPAEHGNGAPVALQREARLAAAPCDGDVIGVEHVLFRDVDGRRILHQAQRQEHLEEAQLVLVDAHRVEGAHVERAHLDVFDAGTAQRLGRPLAGARHALRPDEAVVLVLDLQDVGVELPVLAVHLHA